MDDATKDLTELVDIDPTRVDAVRNPANGFPVLLMKALAPDPAPEAPQPDTPGSNEAEKEAEVPDTPQTPEAPEPQADEPQVEKSLQELVTEEVAKAVQPLVERNQALEAEMATLKSTPIPGGPAVTVPAGQRSSNERAHAAAEATRFERLAKDTSGELSRYYTEKAAEARAAANG